MLETHTDVEPPKSLKIEDAQRKKLLAEQSIALAEWAAKMLIGAEQLGIKTKPVARFPLPDAERAVLMMTPTIDEKIHKKLTAKNPILTVGEVGGLLMEVTEALIDAPPSQGFTLIMTAKSLMNCLEAEVTEASKPAELKGTSSMIYRLKITLSDAKPAIWRRIEVPDLTLGELHSVLQVVMGWENSHMHQFIVGKTYYGQATPDDLDLDVEDEDGMRISKVFPEKKKPRIVYEYDFGDSWLHDIVLEKTFDPEFKVKYPRCVEGARACPPEDCGGIGGYADFLEAIGDPKHPDHRDMKEWIGGKFDLEKFSVDAVNKELRRV